MSEFENIGYRLKTAREAAGFKTARLFCEKYSISASTYCQHELGRRNINLKTAEKYADLLSVNPIWLLRGIGSPYQNEITDEEKPISDEEFIKALRYNGKNNFKIFSQYKNEILNNVNPLLFCNLVSSMTKVLYDLNFKLDITQFSQKAVENYKDIVQSTNNTKSQIAMIDLSVTTFKRQIQALIEQNKKISHG